MSAETVYSGPAKVYRNSVGFFGEGEGDIKFEVEQEQLPVAVGMFGQVRKQQGDVTGKITIKPFDNWGLLPQLYPAYLGAKQGATAAALQMGTLLFGPRDTPVPTKIWVPVDGRLYTAVRTGIHKPPTMHLGVGIGLFDSMEIMTIGDAAKKVGDASFHHTITESGAADPGGQFAMSDFIRESWTGAFGTGAGWGGDGGNAIESEDEWQVLCEVKWGLYKVQKLTRVGKLLSVAWMVKGRPVGPTHTQIDSALGINNGRVLGSSFGSADFVLTSASGKTVTLKNADAVGEGYEFGSSTKLGTGEVGFVNAMTFTAGAANSLIEFSA